MILERLADIIAKRSKLIIAVWIVVVLCSVPFVLKAGEVLNYDTSDMAGTDSESVRGAEIISEYFKPSEIDMGQTPLIVVDYNNEDQLRMAESAEGVLNENIKKYLDGSGEQKIVSVMKLGPFDNGTDSSRGIIMYALVYSQKMIADNAVSSDTKDLRAFVTEAFSAGGIDLTRYVTGSPAMSYDIEKGASDDISKIDPFTILLILILVGLFFRSFVTSAMPPITIGAAFGVAMCIMYFLGSAMDIFYITEMFLLVSMLGAGCDYCIFILARYREERKNGKDHDGALRESIIWAGESIATSGASVIIGFGAMSVCSFSMISTMGIVLAVGIIMALLAALTLITSILSIFGDRLFWPSGSDTAESKNGWYSKVSAVGHRYFLKSAHASIKYAKAIIVAAVLFTIPMAYVAVTAESSYDMVGGMSSGEAAQGMDMVSEYSYGGMIMPDYTVLELNEAIGSVISYDKNFGVISWNESSMERMRALSSLSSTIADSDDNIGTVSGLYLWSDLVKAAAAGIPQGGMTDVQYMQTVFGAVLQKLPIDVAGAGYAMLRNMDSWAHLIPGLVMKYDDKAIASVMDYAINYIAGSVGGKAVNIDPASSDGRMMPPLSITFVKYSVITVESAMSDRSMVTITNVDNTVTAFCNDNPGLVSNTWLTGGAVVMYEISEQVSSEFVKIEILVVVLIFILLFFVMRSYLTPLRSILTILMSVIWTIALTHLLFGSLLGEGVIWMIPIILLVICLGLGMDYDILLTTRIKENHLHRGMSNDDAIVAAVTHSGSVITICGLIMGGAFGTLMLSSTTMLQEFGFALCFAIIVDALIVRTYIVPAAMHILGDWNWKGPKFMHRKDQ